jgi:hypothetical protein
MEAVPDGEESNREAGRNKRAATIMEVRGARSEDPVLRDGGESAVNELTAEEKTF